MTAWNDFGKTPPSPAWDDEARYGTLWTWYAGSWRNDPIVIGQKTAQPALYENTRQIWRQAGAIVALYDQFVYMGSLSTDGQPLPDGTRGAIPIDPQAGEGAPNDQLVRAVHELFNLWYFESMMSIRPRMSAILGDCLTELVDEYKSGRVVPQTFWPGMVKDLELDELGHVKAYAIEYQVNQARSTKFGRDIKEDHYLFRKEVSSDGFWYYRDGKPFAYPDIGPASQSNPYGFAPAIWDRHESVPWSVRGLSALEKTLPQTLELNSVLSHALDYQRKQFAAPVGVKGSATMTRPGKTYTMPGGITVTMPPGADPDPDDLEEAKRKASQALNMIGMSAEGEFVTIKFDIGDTTEMLNLIMDSLLAENPEARYGQEILKMSQVTGPGMERVLAPIVGLIRQARKMHDPQTVKLLQMAISMLGFRLSANQIPPEILQARPARFEAFQPYDLESYGRGLLDFTIPGRDVFPETLLERAQRLQITQTITDPYLQGQAGIPQEEADRMAKEKQDQADAEAALIAGTQANGQDNQQQGDNLNG